LGTKVKVVEAAQHPVFLRYISESITEMTSRRVPDTMGLLNKLVIKLPHNKGPREGLELLYKIISGQESALQCYKTTEIYRVPKRMDLSIMIDDRPVSQREPFESFL